MMDYEVRSLEYGEAFVLLHDWPADAFYFARSIWACYDLSAQFMLTKNRASVQSHIGLMQAFKMLFKSWFLQSAKKHFWFERV